MGETRRVSGATRGATRGARGARGEAANGSGSRRRDGAPVARAGLACTRSRRESTDRVPNARGAASASPVVEDARSCNAKIENQNRIQVRAKPRHLPFTLARHGKIENRNRIRARSPRHSRDYGTVALLVSRSRRTHGRPRRDFLSLRSHTQNRRPNVSMPSVHASPAGVPAMDAGGGGETRLASSSGVGAGAVSPKYARDVVNANDTT